MKKKVYVYLKKTIAKRYVSFDAPLSEEEYDNIGSTWEDYEVGKWVPLTDGQVAYHEAHPEATEKEVWDMAPTPPAPRTMEQAKQEKMAAIEAYDNSSAVNEFTYGEVAMWLDKATRDGLYLRLLAEQAAGKATTTLWFGTMSFELAVEQAVQMLYAIEVYASGCYDTTAAHKAAIAEMDSIEAVDAYDHTAGYPEKLVFNA